MPVPNVSVIGAGPAGLTVSYFLTRQGLQPEIYESSKEIGGLAGAARFWGKSFDIGPHIFLESSQPEAVRFWKEIGGNDLQRLVLSRGMILEKRLIRYPPAPGGLIRAIGFFSFCMAGASALKARLFANKEMKSAGDFFGRHYGNYFRRLVFKPYCEKYMGIADKQVDTGFATGLTSFIKEAGKTDVDPEKTKLKTLLYHKQGTKVMWTRIAEKILEKGAIHFEKKIIKIQTKGTRIERLYFNDGTTGDPDFLVSTLPLPLLVSLLDECPAEILEETKRLTSRNTVLVYLRLKTGAFAYQYITVFDHSLEAGRITNFNSWTNGNTTKDETVLCVEYWCNSGDDNWISTDAEIAAKAMSELENAGIANKNNVMGCEVLRLPNSHPVLNVGYAASLDRINSYLAQFENLALAGRHGSFKWDGQADNIITGMRLAEKIGQLFPAKA